MTCELFLYIIIIIIINRNILFNAMVIRMNKYIIIIIINLLKHIYLFITTNTSNSVLSRIHCLEI